MKTRIIQFFTLIVYMSILNIVFHCFGVLFVSNYQNWVFSELKIGDIFFLAKYAFLQIFVFPIEKKYRIIIVAWFFLTIALILTHNDVDGIGWEVWSTIVYSISKFNHFFQIIFNNMKETDFVFFLSRLNPYIFFSIYLIFVGYSFKDLYSKISTFITKKRPF